MATVAPNITTSAVLTEEQRADFACLCDDLRSGNITKLNAATKQLKTLPPLRVQALLIDLWQQVEPARRRRKRRIRALSTVLLCLWVAVLVLMVCFAICDLCGVKMQHHWLLTTIMAGLGCKRVYDWVNRQASTPRQRGAFDVLLEQKTLNVTRLYVDALDFNTVSGPVTHSPDLREVLATLLPQYAASDAPPLDAYQQQILLREVEQFTRRLRKPGSPLNDTEFRFVNAAVTYLMDRQEQQVETPVTSAIQQLATLTPSRDETPNRRLVCEVAAEYVPVVQAGNVKR